MKNRGFTGSATAIMTVTVLACVFFFAGPLKAEAPITYQLPDGWVADSERAAVAAATSPDKTVRLIVRYFPLKGRMQAIQIIKGQKTKVKHDKVITPPTDMSRLKKKFNADSVAKMQLACTAANGGKFLYRAFVFVKGGNFVVIEAFVNTKADKKTFKQTDGTVESFRFN